MVDRKQFMSKFRLHFFWKYPANHGNNLWNVTLCADSAKKELWTKSKKLIWNQNEKSLLAQADDKLCTNSVTSLVHLHITFKPWPQKTWPQVTLRWVAQYLLFVTFQKFLTALLLSEWHANIHCTIEHLHLEWVCNLKTKEWKYIGVDGLNSCTHRRQGGISTNHNLIG